MSEMARSKMSSREPVQVTDDENELARLSREFGERLSDLFETHQLEPTADGWRNLALNLALKHEPEFQIETPVDRVGRSGIGGRPIGFSGFIHRSVLKNELRKGGTKAQAAKRAHKRLLVMYGDKAPSVLTLQNMFSQKGSTPDVIRRSRYEVKAHKALDRASRALSR